MGIDLKARTRVFFDRPEVIRAVGRANASALSRAGAFTRRKAKSSIRYRKKPSSAGKPPSAHGKWSPLRELIFFGYDPRTKSVVIGPEIFGTAGGIVPGTLERGGRAAGRINPRRKKRVLGKAGEIRIGGPSCRSTKEVRTFKNTFVEVTFTRLTSEDQVARANQLNEELYGPARLPGAAIEPRPFMLPALEDTQQRLPELWKDSLVAN